MWNYAHCIHQFKLTRVRYPPVNKQMYFRRVMVGSETSFDEEKVVESIEAYEGQNIFNRSPANLWPFVEVPTFGDANFSYSLRY